MQEMTLAEHLIQGAGDGRVAAAVWHGRHEVETGPMRLRSPDGSVAIEVAVTDVRHKPFSEVDDREARDSGEEDAEALWHVLSRAYPSMTRSDEVTVALLR
ncbi:ASCH domain-containing protein [Roseitranquillus sediminis]|uniref:ASCH domain-containing protein n=1 Tax=Roseitranquillus sediminis TaxID=2809051 RepID=UPI001D0C9AB7|nr:ASCH domain-containing protein [Roseitranquillus sediminis]MBM9594832.1 ASCH domain-containing protein [Roseitranquillus sediminis]